MPATFGDRVVREGSQRTFKNLVGRVSSSFRDGSSGGGSGGIGGGGRGGGNWGRVSGMTGTLGGLHPAAADAADACAEARLETLTGVK